MFLSANAGKRSLGLSLRDPHGREALLRLADRADVFLQSLRPGHAEELGLGPEALRARNRALVYCTVGAYGRVGPLSREPGYDALMQAAGGLISVTGEPGPPRRTRRRVPRSTRARACGRRSACSPRCSSESELARAGWSTSRSTRPRSAYIGYHLAGYLADGTVPAGAGDALPDGRAVPGVPDAGRRADDRGRERSAVRARSATCSALPALIDDPRFRTNPRQGREPRRARPRFSRSGSGRTTRRTGTSASWPQACRPRRSRTSPTSPPSPQTEALGMLQPLASPGGSPTSASRPCRCASTANERPPLATARSRPAHGRDPHGGGLRRREIAALAARGVITP